MKITSPTESAIADEYNALAGVTDKAKVKSGLKRIAILKAGGKPPLPALDKIAATDISGETYILMMRADGRILVKAESLSGLWAKIRATYAIPRGVGLMSGNNQIHYV